jgi:hypothetical protein
MTFETWTVVVVLLIYVVFSFAAHKADKVVEAKAKERREAQLKLASKTKK